MGDVTNPKTIAELDEMRARILCRERNCEPETLCQHHEWEDWPTDRKDDKGRLFHYGWRRYLKTARAIRESDAAAGLTVVHGFDTSTAPHHAVRECVPLVLYFGSRADADEFIAVVHQVKPGMIAVDLKDAPS